MSNAANVIAPGSWPARTTSTIQFKNTRHIQCNFWYKTIFQFQQQEIFSFGTSLYLFLSLCFSVLYFSCRYLLTKTKKKKAINEMHVGSLFIYFARSIVTVVKPSPKEEKMKKTKKNNEFQHSRSWREYPLFSYNIYAYGSRCGF